MAWAYGFRDKRAGFGTTKARRKMNTIQSRTQSDYFAASLLVKPSVEAPAARPPEPKNDPLPDRWSWLGKLAPLVRYPFAFCIGVAATLAWQSYGDAPRGKTAPAALAASQQQFNAMSHDLDAVRQGIDRIAAALAASEEQTRRSVDQLAAGHEWMTRDFSSKLDAVEHNILEKISAPPPRPAPPRNPAPRPAQAPMVHSGIP